MKILCYQQGGSKRVANFLCEGALKHIFSITLTIAHMPTKILRGYFLTEVIFELNS